MCGMRFVPGSLCSALSCSVRVLMHSYTFGALNFAASCTSPNIGICNWARMILKGIISSYFTHFFSFWEMTNYLPPLYVFLKVLLFVLSLNVCIFHLCCSWIIHPDTVCDSDFQICLQPWPSSPCLLDPSVKGQQTLVHRPYLSCILFYKVLLKYSLTHLFTYVHGCFLCCSDRVG